MRVLDSIELARYVEGLVGLENLCSNLADFDITMTDEETRHALAITDLWGLSDRDRKLRRPTRPRGLRTPIGVDFCLWLVDGLPT